METFRRIGELREEFLLLDAGFPFRCDNSGRSWPSNWFRWNSVAHISLQECECESVLNRIWRKRWFIRTEVFRDFLIGWCRREGIQVWTDGMFKEGILTELTQKFHFFYRPENFILHGHNERRDFQFKMRAWTCKWISAWLHLDRHLFRNAPESNDRKEKAEEVLSLYRGRMVWQSAVKPTKGIRSIASLAIPFRHLPKQANHFGRLQSLRSRIYL